MKEKQVQVQLQQLIPSEPMTAFCLPYATILLKKALELQQSEKLIFIENPGNLRFTEIGSAVIDALNNQIPGSCSVSQGSKEDADKVILRAQEFIKLFYA